MTFGPQHYMPVLKVKGGEKAALRQIAPTAQARIIPLLEIVARAEKPLAAHLNTAFKGLADGVGPYPRCFIDAREIAPDGPAAAVDVFERASNAGIIFSPVTGISRTADVVAALNHRTHGLAVRVTRAEFEDGDLHTRIQDFLSLHELAPADVDLIIDLGAVEDLISDGIAALTEAFLADVPHHQLWRTFTVSACAFPRGMGGVARHSHDFVERGDWLSWREHLHSRRADLARLPTFSDYAIQHPSGVEGFNFRTMRVSASIRYTLEENWLLIKGESTRSVLPSEQFPELATRLVYGQFQPHFAGAGHCAGCQSIKNAADGAAGLGSAGAWRRIGTVHHISAVMQGLGSLPWP